MVRHRQIHDPGIQQEPEQFRSQDHAYARGRDRAIPNPNLLIKGFAHEIKHLLKNIVLLYSPSSYAHTLDAPMPTRLMQVYEQRGGYKPALPQPFDFSRHAKPPEKTPYAYRRQAT